MKKQLLTLSTLGIVGLGFTSYKITNAFFTDTAVSTTNVLSAATEFNTTVTPTITGQLQQSQIADHLVISEVQIDGGTAQANDNDFIELYNPTSSDINLVGFRLVKRTGSSPNDTNIIEFTSNHVIPAHGYFLWANDDFSNISSAPDVTSSDVLGASNSVAIRQGALNTGTIIDALSWDAAASSLKEGTQFGSNPIENQSIERKAFVTSDITSMTSGVDSTRGNGQDSDNNANDFIIRTTSQPQNSSSAIETP